MKKLYAAVMGGMLILTVFSLGSAKAVEQTDDAASAPATRSMVNAPAAKDDYNALEKDLKQDRLKDALQRIQILEQDVRFLRRRVELLERDVNDIKNDRYNRTNP